MAHQELRRASNVRDADSEKLEVSIAKVSVQSCSTEVILCGLGLQFVCKTKRGVPEWTSDPYDGLGFRKGPYVNPGELPRYV